MESGGSGKSTISVLPLEILLSIFEHLDTRNKGRAAQVCSSWNEAINHTALWSDFEVTLQPDMLNSETKNCIIRRGIKRIRFVNGCVNKGLFDVFKNAPNIESLSLTDCSDLLDEHFVDIRRNFPLLRDLTLSGCPRISEQMVHTVALNFKALQKLYLDECVNNPLKRVTDDKAFLLPENALVQFGHILKQNWPDFSAVMGVLKYRLIGISEEFYTSVVIDPRDNRLESISEIRCLPFLENLVSLNLSFSITFTSASLDCITNITSLQHLDLTACALITDDGFQSISRLANLISLNLSLCFGITDVTLKHLNQLTSLRKLNLHSTVITDRGLFHLTDGALQLTELDLTSTNIEDEGLLHICGSSFRLQDLFFSFTRVTDHGIRQVVEKFPHLQYLKSESLHFITCKNYARIYETMSLFYDTDLDEYMKYSFYKHINCPMQIVVKRFTS